MLTTDERTLLADTLLAYAENVQENLDDDNDTDDAHYPVVEDYQADADRIRMGETPLHDLTREVLTDDTGASALVDEPEAFRALVARLYA